VLRLNRAERELGADGAALVHDVLVLGMTMEQIGERRGLRGQRWIDYLARRLRECLDRLALIYGFAAERRCLADPNISGTRAPSARDNGCSPGSRSDNCDSN